MVGVRVSFKAKAPGQICESADVAGARPTDCHGSMFCLSLGHFSRSKWEGGGRGGAGFRGGGSG